MTSSWTGCPNLTKNTCTHLQGGKHLHAHDHANLVRFNPSVKSTRQDYFCVRLLSLINNLCLFIVAAISTTHGILELLGLTQIVKTTIDVCTRKVPDSPHPQCVAQSAQKIYFLQLWQYALCWQLLPQPLLFQLCVHVCVRSLSTQLVTVVEMPLSFMMT